MTTQPLDADETAAGATSTLGSQKRCIPRHVAVILDGNRRWARGQGLGPVDGHRVGASRLFEAVEWGEEAGIQTMTLWVLSADNLRRPAGEVAGLLPLIAEVVDGLADRRRWAIRHLGRAEILPAYLQRSLRRAEHTTYGSTGMTINMAVGYDGRCEIADAVRKAMADPAAATTSRTCEAWQELITKHLYTAGQPDPDLIIRTSGEQRLSGFLLWQSTWSEYYFCDRPWPAFTRADFDAALASYAARQRRFGR